MWYGKLFAYFLVLRFFGHRGAVRFTFNVFTCSFALCSRQVILRLLPVLVAGSEGTGPRRCLPKKFCHAIRSGLDE